MDFLQSWSPRVLSILRIVAGLLFVEHGTSKLLHFPPVDMFNDLQPFTLIWFAGVIELVGGVLVTLGLFTRPAAFIMSGEMAAAYFMAHAPKSPYPVLNQGGGAILFCFVFLYLAFAGGGEWSLDRMLRPGAKI